MRRITTPRDTVVVLVLSAILSAFLYLLLYGDAKRINVFIDRAHVLKWQNDKPVG